MNKPATVNFLSAMDMVVMKHESKESFTLPDEIPACFKCFFLSDNKEERIINPADIFPFLTSFIDDSGFLVNGKPELAGTSKSGWWTEIDKDDEAHYLQAVSTSLCKNNYLLIRHASASSEIIGSLRQYREAMIEFEHMLEEKDNDADNPEVMPDLLLKDSLTGLHNKRAFLLLAEQQHNMAKRNKVATLIMMLEFAHLEAITKKFGEAEASNSIKAAANILKKTFRGTDVIARLGEDGLFVVLALEIVQNGEKAIMARLKNNIERHNKFSFKTYDIAFTTGVVNYGFDQPGTMQELLQIARLRLKEDRISKKL
ncbi:MAG: GGDEF domain-containing protein [Deltaproteobacteria bacterium]|nr:GGDEF domain-containing protein [Deltaproteobacteria bacterium]